MTPQQPFVPDMKIKPEVKAFFDKETETFSYVVKDPDSSSCAVVDSVTNLEYASGTISYEGADEIIAWNREHDLSLEWIIETHVHADHLSAAPYIKQKLGGKVGIGKNVTVVQKVFAGIFNTGDEFKCDGSQFDKLFSDGDSYQIGSMTAYVMHTPGHTPACMTHVIGDAAFVGDTLFMPDVGTARADFPGGDASTLFHSITKVLSLPYETRLFMCHDYPPTDRPVQFETTVAAQRAGNIHVKDGTSVDEFVAMRQARDATLAMPVLILPAVQINVRAGQMPPAEDNGVAYVKIPLNAL